ncbi:MAG: hypothetical protein DRI54_01095 [Bacteroidetes bacterium]|nr:MAG: hypothetical protein DRI54_01095 [Bacteroidota bacterium]
MSNKASNQLFLLIKSLSKQEKRYFKIFSNRHSSDNNNYYKLYQIISQQEEYDEEKVIEKLKDQQFVNRLSIAKTRLYDQLLKSLNAYHSSKTVDSELFFILQSIEVLYHKALYKAAWKKLQRGLKLAKKYEKYELTLQLYKWEHKLLEKENYESLDSDNLDLMWNAESTVVDQIKIYNKLWYIKSKIFKILFYSGSRTRKNIAMVNLFLKKNIDSIDQSELSVRSKFLLHHIYSAYNYSVNELEKSYDHLKLNLQLMERFPWMFVDNPYTQISLVSNMAFIGFKLRKNEDINSLLIKLKELKKAAEASDVNLHIRWFYSYYSIYLAVKSAHQSIKIDQFEINQIYKGLDKFEDNLPTFRRLDLQFALSVYYFKAGETRTALRGVHSILNELNSKLNPEMFFAARFFYLVLLLEMEKIDYLNVAWTSTKRSLSANKSLSPEGFVLKEFFDQVCKNGQPDLYTLLEKLIANLDNLKLNRYIEYFDFKKWAIDKKESFQTTDAMAS